MNKQDYYRQKYQALNPTWQDSLKLYIDLIDTEVKKESKVLDIGCGHGNFLKKVYAKTPHTYGLDPDKKGLNKNTIIKHKTEGTADNLPYQDNFFDLVTSTWVLEHLENPKKVFSEIYRVLKPGGKVIFLTPNSKNYIVWINRLIPDIFHDFLTKHLYGRKENDTFPVKYLINSPKKINQILSKLNFKKEELILNGDPSYISFNNLLFKISCLIEKILSYQKLNSFKVHLIGKFKK